jgi:octaprenyl-diphosphate synthase
MPDASSPASNGRASLDLSAEDEPLTPDRSVPTTLDDIRGPVEEDLEAFRSYFQDAMRSDHMLLDKITQYVLWKKGTYCVILSSSMWSERIASWK